MHISIHPHTQRNTQTLLTRTLVAGVKLAPVESLYSMWNEKNKNPYHAPDLLVILVGKAVSGAHIWFCRSTGIRLNVEIFHPTFATL